MSQDYLALLITLGVAVIVAAWGFWKALVNIE